MGILFLILKILGIFLAVLLLLVIVFLSVPVRYGFSIKVQDDLEGKAVIHWLFHLVDVRLYYRQKGISFRLRILGIPIPLDREKKGNKENVKKKKSPESRKKKKEKISSEKEESFSLTEEEINNREYLQEEKSQEDLDTFASVKRDKKTEEPKKSRENTDDFSLKEKKRGKRRKQGFRERLKAGIRSIKNGFRNLIQSLEQRLADLKNGTTTIKEQTENIKNLISEETNQNAFRCLMGEFRYLLRHYSPKHASGTVRFAMNDPSQTGKVLGVMSLLPYWTRYKMVLMPDFTSDSFYCRGNLCIKGHIRILHVLVSGIRLIKNKNIRQLITNIRE